MRMTLTIDFATVPRTLEFSETEGVWYAFNRDLNATAEGATKAEASAHFEDAVSQLFEFCLESNIAIPAPLVTATERQLVAS